MGRVVAHERHGPCLEGKRQCLGFRLQSPHRLLLGAQAERHRFHLRARGEEQRPRRSDRPSRGVKGRSRRIGEMEPSLASDDSSVTEILSGLELFDELSDQDRNALGKSSTIIDFLPGDTIMAAYERGDNFYIIIVGEAVVWRTDALSYEHRVADLTGGDIMGESALLAEYESGRHIRSATIKAESPCILLRISMRSMLKVLQKYPVIKDAFQSIHDERGAEHAPKISND